MNSPPTTLGQYQIIREIARSNDIVYEAYDPLMNRRVAVKELAMPQGATGPQQEERISRFKREAQAAGTLNHPNIMTVFSFAEDAGRTFMAMEYLDGGTLRSEIDTKGSLPVDRAVEIATAVLEGLGHAHSKGVIHRDIKPDNIQILANGSIKITDFGIARLTFQPNLTMDGQVFGTPSYMSPEQVVGKEIDQRSDLFSVGVVLYEMLNGQKPFAGDSVVSITYAIMNAEPPRLAQVEFALWQVIAKALEKSPQMRYANADEMIRALKSATSVQNFAMGSPTAPSVAGMGANPYMTPPPPPVIAQPIYSYNPYQPQQQQAPPSPYQTAPYQPNSYGAPGYQNAAYAYQAGPSMPPPGQLPIYYPPPPRVPMMKPETAAFVKKTLIAFVLVGTLVILILVGLSALTESIRNASRDRMDNQALPDSLKNVTNTIPTADKVSLAHAELAKHPSDGRRAEIKQWISKQYENSGKQYLSRMDLVHAEFDFSRGTAEDPTNANLWSSLGYVLMMQSETQQDPKDKASVLDNAGDDWNKAYTLESNSKRKQDDATRAVDAYMGAAESALSSGDRDQMALARQRLYGAKSLTTDSSTIAKIEELIQKSS